MKTCTKCGERKPVELFPATDRNKEGRISWCESCNRAYYREYRRKQYRPRINGAATHQERLEKEFQRPLDEIIRAAYAVGKTNAKVAALLDVSTPWLIIKCKEYGIPRPDGRKV